MSSFSSPFSAISVPSSSTARSSAATTTTTAHLTPPCFNINSSNSSSCSNQPTSSRHLLALDTYGYARSSYKKSNTTLFNIRRGNESSMYDRLFRSRTDLKTSVTKKARLHEQLHPTEQPQPQQQLSTIKDEQNQRETHLQRQPPPPPPPPPLETTVTEATEGIEHRVGQSSNVYQIELQLPLPPPPPPLATTSYLNDHMFPDPIPEEPSLSPQPSPIGFETSSRNNNNSSIPNELVTPNTASLALQISSSELDSSMLATTMATAAARSTASSSMKSSFSSADLSTSAAITATLPNTQASGPDQYQSEYESLVHFLYGIFNKEEIYVCLPN